MPSERLRLQPGVYVVVANGALERGGLKLEAWDPAHRTLLAGAYYSSGQVGFSSGRMQAQVALTRPGTIELVVANWGPTPIVSKWLLRSIEIVRLPSPRV